MSLDKYEKAVVLWLADHCRDSRGRKLNPQLIDPASIRFDVERGGCDTCGWEDPSVEFKYNGNWRQVDLRSVTPVELIQQCLAKVGAE